jgi:RNA polymerase sigma factor (sigma-70 family)
VTAQRTIFLCHKSLGSGVIQAVGTEVDDDRALVRRLRCADRHAFRELYALYAQPTFRFLVRLSGRLDQAEDLHQETWLAVARHAATLAADSDVAAWIFTIARNQFRSAHRSARRFRPPEAAAPEAVGHDDPAAHDLERALGALPEGHREILLLVAIEGLAIDQVAAVLVLRPDAARQRLARARAALAELLAAADLPAAATQRRGVR